MSKGPTDKHMNRPALFKKCPKCGKHFEVKHIEQVVERKDELVKEERTYLSPAGVASAYPIPTAGQDGPAKVEVEEEVEEDYYTDTYRCSHCGYTWTEKREKTRDLGAASGATDC
jgi:transposase-like protein